MTFKLFKRKEQTARPTKAKSPDRGFLAFANTSEVIKAESLIKGQGWKVRVMGPPPELRTGCDLVIEFPLVEQLNILRLLEENKLTPLEVVPVDDPLLKPVDLFKTTDYGQYLMVRAANMKLTIDKKLMSPEAVVRMSLTLEPYWWEKTCEKHPLRGIWVTPFAGMPCNWLMRR